MKSDNTSLIAVAILLNSVHWRSRLINQIRVKYVELIALDNLGRRIVVIVMSLVVLVPLISGMNPIEIFWLSWTVFIMPPINLEQ